MERKIKSSPAEKAVRMLKTIIVQYCVGNYTAEIAVKLWLRLKDFSWKFSVTKLIYYECRNYRENRHCCSHYIREEIIITELEAALEKYADLILSSEYRKNVYKAHRTELKNVRKAILDIQAEREEKNEELR